MITIASFAGFVHNLFKMHSLHYYAHNNEFRLMKFANYLERTVWSELPNLRRNLLRGVQRPVREGDGSHRRTGGDGAGGA